MSTLSQRFQEHSLGLEGVPNARDLGGFPADANSRVKKGLLLRGGALHKATEFDIRELDEHFSVCEVYDLRTDRELSQAPDPVIGSASYIWLPTIDQDTDAIKDMALPEHAYSNLGPYIVAHSGDRDVQALARGLYIAMVDNEYTQLQTAVFLTRLTKLSNGSVFWHCSQGKDRTGLISAFTLAALGASRETIIEDYDISNDFYKGEIECICARVAQNGGDALAVETAKAFIGANTAYFELALDHIEKEYGSMERYLSDRLFVTDRMRSTLRERFLQ